MLKTLKDYIMLIVRPSWKPLLYGILGLVAIGVASNIFAGQRLAYTELSKTQDWVEQNTFSARQVEYCAKSIGVGYSAIDMRDEGLTLQDALDDLDGILKALKKEAGITVDRHIFLELSRMIYTVFRHPKMDKSAYHKQFYAECMGLGRY